MGELRTTNFTLSDWSSEMAYEHHDTELYLKSNNSTQWPTDNFTAAPAHEQFYKNAQFVTGLICYPTICLIGTISNIMILIVLAQKNMQTSTNVFLSALAVSDLFKLLNDWLYFFTILLLETEPAAGNKAFGYLYPYAHFVFNMSVCVSSWLTVSVAVERYILVCHPTRAMSITSIYRSKVISATCYIVMTAIAIPSALRYTTVVNSVVKNGVNSSELDVELTSLWKNDTFVMTYNWIQSLLRSIIPLVILVITSAFIINALRQTRANKKMASRNKITIMLVMVIFFFLVCIIPDAVMSAFFNLGYAESDNNLVKGVREITDMLLGVNAAINFTLYLIFNKIFRDTCLGLFRKWNPRREQVRKERDKNTQYTELTAVKEPTNGECNNSAQARL